MRRLALFLALLAAILVAAGLLVWWIDPFGEFYKPAVLREADRTGCLISDELIGGQSYLAFKEDVFRVRPTRTIVVGSSRVLKIRPHPGERTFSNLGLPSTSPFVILDLFRSLHPRGPLTVYLGVDEFWFNPSWRATVSFHHGVEERLRYLLNRANVVQSLKMARSTPWLLRDRWRRETIGGRCVLGRATPALVWYPDGSRLYSFELEPGLYHPPVDVFTPDLSRLRGGNYANWHALDATRLHQLDEALALAQRRGWKVVGFPPPDSTRYARFFAGSPETRGPWREFFERVPALFRAHGFRWLDLRDVRDVPCGQRDFVDDGFHVNAACAAKIRQRLDAAARAR
jgi:hypothetical protein